MAHPIERIALFIDGPNLSISSQRGLKLDIDYKKLLDYFSRDAFIVRAYYYVAVQSDDELKTNSFLSWLNLNGFYLVTKQIKEFGDERKGNLDVEIAIDMIELADKVDRVVLFSGDGDFAPVLHRLATKGIRTQVVSHWSRGKRKSIASELIGAADIFTELGELAPYIRKDN
jgi:uncharacterized LabA/DUF88 family protein